jgi:DNA topoisomerase-1
MEKRFSGAIIDNPKKSARQVGLKYVSDQQAGIRRAGSGSRLRYFSPTGRVVRDAAVLRRIKSLAIPPAWTEVWIASDENAHLQATGRDARRRKQYRYHPKWREIRDDTKYARMLAFAAALPGIRRRVRRDLAMRGLPREKVLAAVVRLLEVSLIRVGNDEYARQNHSFGLTTMKDRHVAIRGTKIRFHFRGKSGKDHDVDLEDGRLAKIVRQCQEIPGQELFQYFDDEGRRRDVTSGDVNDYLREISGEEFTAKDFRTWAGTVLAALALNEFEKVESNVQARKNVVAAIESVAKRLGNTPAICRKCYIHPEVLNSYLDGSMVRMLQVKTEKQFRENPGRLKPEEAAVLGLLRRRLARRAEPLERVLARELNRRGIRAPEPNRENGWGKGRANCRKS